MNEGDGISRGWPARLKDGWPLTWTGTLLLALAGAAFWFQGVRRLDLVLLAASALAVLLVLFLAAASLAAAFLLRRRPAPVRGPLHLEGEVWNDLGPVAGLPAWIPFLRLRVRWLDPPDVDVLLDWPGGERVRARRRARAWAVRRRWAVGDVLGIAEVAWRRQDPADLRILPPPAALHPAAAFLGFKAGEEVADPRGGLMGDRVDIRKYGPGDPMRSVLWKVYARTRKAFVRMPERALEPAPRVCAYLPAGPQDEPPARLARTLLESGRLGPGWRFGADGAGSAETLEEALDALAASGSGEPPSGLAAFLREAAADGFGTCLVLAPGRPGPWEAPVAAALAGAPLQAHLVLALDGWAPEPDRGWRRWVLRREPGEGAEPAALLDLHRRLAAPGLASTLVDIRSGQAYPDPPGHLARLAGVRP